MVVALSFPSDLSEPSAESSAFNYWKRQRESESESESKHEKNRDRERKISENSIYYFQLHLTAQSSANGQPIFKGGCGM